jgi:hypothetical protein
VASRTLAELLGPSGYARPAWNASQLDALQKAVGRMFDDMNKSFFDRVDMEFQRKNSDRLVRTFLSRFDAIFTLNQDVLLEHYYCSDNVALRTAHPIIPGMRFIPNVEPLYSSSWSRAKWTSRPKAEFTIPSNTQPIFKLHGSSNWASADGRQLQLIGGEKLREIGRHPILNSYAKQFEQYVNGANRKLMVIGYGFRDPHVNSVLAQAVERGLKMFVIDPAGAELAFKLTPSRLPGGMGAPNDLEGMLQASLIGGSRRQLSEIFAIESAEFGKVMRFFR